MSRPAPWTEDVTVSIRSASLELVTRLREQPTPEGRVEAFTHYINRVYLPSLDKAHRAQGLGMLLASLALDFAVVLDASNEAAQVFLQHALLTAANPLG